MLRLNTDHLEFFGVETIRHLDAATGYTHLKLLKNALAELEEIAEEDQSSLSFLIAKTRVLIFLKRFRPAEQLAARGIKKFPCADELIVQRSFALYQMRKAKEAADVIQGAPERIRNTGVLIYNLACYGALHGDLRFARRALVEACGINSELRKNARLDEDLQNICER